ncbi:MAG: 50S ribosomal protein L21 [Armatimonadota bacterium]|nr:50S ribosomal protein L21 [Armatimonadota bacterium]
MYAIIRSGGKQYRVAENSVVRLELLDARVGSQVELSDVALLGGDSQVHIGRPTVEGARVLGKIVAHGRTRRIVVYKYKPKKGYHRRRGHRQNYHDVLIQQVLAPGQEPRQRRAHVVAAAPDSAATAAPIEAVEPAPLTETAPASEAAV